MNLKRMLMAVVLGGCLIGGCIIYYYLYSEMMAFRGMDYYERSR
jgi:hypothetical protein